MGLVKRIGSKMRRIPRWLKILLMATAVVAVAGLVLPNYLDVDRYRTLIAGVIESKSGRKVTIRKIRARLLPSVGFVVEDFHLGNPPGMAEGDVLSVEAVRGHLALGPLLRGEFQLSSVELVRPKIVLLEDDRGQTNYGTFSKTRTASGAASRASQKAAGTSGAPDSSVPSALAQIDSVKLTDAEVILGRLPPNARDARTLIPTLHAKNIRAQLNHVTLDPLQPKQWGADARLAGILLELAGWKAPVEFRSGNLQLRDGRIEAEFRLAMGKAGVFKGSLHIADIERAVPNFELSATQLDLDQLIALRTETPGGARPAQGPSALLAQGRLSAEHIRSHPYTAGNTAAEVRLFTDRLELWPVTVQLYGGILQVSARVDRRQAPERFSSNVQVHNLDVGALLAVSPATRGKLSGTGELNLQLFGALTNEWRKVLSGKGQFTIRNGRLPGVNLSGAGESLAKLTGMSGETPFSLIQGDLGIGQGRVASRQIHMDSPHGIVDMHGSCSLDGALEYDGQAVVNPGGAAAAGALGDILGGILQREVGRMTVPFSIRGTLQDPKIQPGRGGPRVESSSPASQPTQTQPQKRKSIIDIFRRP
jgi:hypothetical protein